MKATGPPTQSIGRIVSRFALSVGRCASLTFISAICVSAGAVQQDYQTGKLVEISDRKIDVGRGSMPLMFHMAYVLQIQTGDSSYSILIDNRSYDLEWIVGNSIQFRIENKHIFLRRLKGKELKVKLLGVTPLQPGTALSDVPSTPPPRQLQLNTLSHRGIVPMGVDFLRGNNMCVGVTASIDLVARLDSSERKPPKRERTKGGLFPERTIVRILLSIHRCAATDLDLYLGPDEMRPDFPFDNDFIQKLRFEAFWKNGFETKPANLQVLTEAQVKWPRSLSLLTQDADWWEYELEIRGIDIPQTDALAVNVLAPDGRLICRFSGRP